LCVNPVNVADWGHIYAFLSELYMTSTVAMQKQVMQLVPRDYCMPVGELIDKNKNDEPIILQPDKIPVGLEILPIN
jgi:hypothetical protein